MARLSVLFALLLGGGAVATAQTVTPPSEGGPSRERLQSIGRDAGPARQPPQTDGPQSVNRGSDGSAVGLTAPDATGTTPQGMLGSSTAGGPRPDATGGTPPARDPRPVETPQR